MGQNMENEPLAQEARAILTWSAAILRVSRRGLCQKLKQLGLDLLPGQYRILQCLAEQDLTLTVLSREICLDPSTLVPLVDSLVLRGLVQRQQDPADRRKSWLCLTPAGRTQVETMAPFEREEMLIQALRSLGAEKSQELVTLLHELIDGIAAQEVTD
jgi:DNA-binding MarR family transcriptional regulator